MQPYVAWATLFMVVMVILFSGMHSQNDINTGTDVPRLRCVYNRQFHGLWVPDVLSEYCHLCWYASPYADLIHTDHRRTIHLLQDIPQVQGSALKRN